MTSRSEFVDTIPPLRERLRLYDGARRPTDQPRNDAADPAKAVPQSFIDAMIVREEVYVQEQKVPLEEEFDEDDPRSYHWVAYASIPSKEISSSSEPNNSSISNHSSSSNSNSLTRRKTSTSTKIPIGTIRIVPPPHPPHPNSTSSSSASSSTHDPSHKEPYIQLGRLAVIKEFRKTGISRLLVETAFAYIRDHGAELMPHADPSKMEALTQGLHDSVASAAYDFRGLLLVHSQTGVQRFWSKYGFVADEKMGRWNEVGIEHVGMWRRLDVEGSRRKSRVTLN